MLRLSFVNRKNIFEKLPVPHIRFLSNYSKCSIYCGYWSKHLRCFDMLLGATGCWTKNVTSTQTDDIKRPFAQNPNGWFYLNKKRMSPRRGIEPRPPAWQAGILTTRLSRTDSCRKSTAFEFFLTYVASCPENTMSGKQSFVTFTGMLYCWEAHRGKKWNSFEPDLNQRPMDFCFSFQLQSTALPTELSKVARSC